MAGKRNNMGLPPGLGVPAALQQRLKQINQQAKPFRTVASNQYGPSVKTVGRGSLVYFNYLFWQHDPYPLIIITGIFPNYISGINLHYLTFPYIKKILQPQLNSANCDNPNFSYNNIRNVPYIVDAFRLYKRSGIKSLKSLDCEFILNVMASVRSMDPNEIETIRNRIREQMRSRQPRADQMSQQYMGMMQGQPQTGFENPLPHPVLPAEEANVV